MASDKVGIDPDVEKEIEKFKMSCDFLAGERANIRKAGYPPPAADAPNRSLDYITESYNAAGNACACRPQIEAFRIASEKYNEAKEEFDISELEIQAAKREVLAATLGAIECGTMSHPEEKAACAAAKAAEMAAATKKLEIAKKRMVRAERELKRATPPMLDAVEKQKLCLAVRRISLTVDYDVMRVDPSGQMQEHATGRIEFLGGTIPGSVGLLTASAAPTEQMHTTDLLATGKGDFSCLEDDGHGHQVRRRCEWARVFSAVATVRVKDVASRRMSVIVQPFHDTAIVYVGAGCIPRTNMDEILSQFVMYQNTKPTAPELLISDAPGKATQVTSTLQPADAGYRGSITWIVTVD